LTIQTFSCNHCDATLTGEERYCTACGVAVDQTQDSIHAAPMALNSSASAATDHVNLTQSAQCAKCGAENLVGSKFCANCGMAMANHTSQSLPLTGPVNGRTASIQPQVDTRSSSPAGASVFCRLCGSPISPLASFCSACGAIAKPAEATSNYFAQKSAGLRDSGNPTTDRISSHDSLAVHCTQCGSVLVEGLAFCERCGAKSEIKGDTLEPVNGELADFGIRLAADLIDSVFLIGVLVLFSWSMIVDIPLSIALTAFYGALTEGSEAQASLGKRMLGLKVTNLQGTRAPHVVIFFRWMIMQFLVMTVLGWLTFLAIPFTKNRQGLHDMLCGTLVWKVR